MPRAKKPNGRPRGPGKEDLQIGGRLRALRMDRGLSQDELGQQVGVSFQQIQKYEKGMNRVSASRLNQIATILKTTTDELSGFNGGAQVGGIEFDIESYKLAKVMQQLPVHLKAKFRSLITAIIEDEAAH
jgi:transcriptional regulator with XRE-family HTH domain